MKKECLKMNIEEFEERKGIVLGTLTDLVSNFLLYDRKEDEELPVGVIEEMAHWDKENFCNDLVDHFRRELESGVNQ